jgi:hypothetical protein
MKNEHTKKEECVKFAAILTEESETTETPGQKEFKSEHMTQCAKCRHEAGAYEVMRFDGSAGPAQPWNDIERHRWINAVIEQSEGDDTVLHLDTVRKKQGEKEANSAQEAGSAQRKEIEQNRDVDWKIKVSPQKQAGFEQETGRQMEIESNKEIGRKTVGAEKVENGADRELPGAAGGRRLWLKAVIGLAAIVLVGLGSWLVWHLFDGSFPAGVKNTADHTDVRVVLAAGDVQSEGAAIGLGSLLHNGQKLIVEDGSVALRLPEGSMVLVESDTVLKIEEATQRSVELKLKRGAITCRVTPLESRSCFGIHTQRSRVEVKGTVFSVRISADGDTVAVHKGRVLATLKSVAGKAGEPADRLVDVRCGQRAVLGQGSVHKGVLSDREKRVFVEKRSLIELLGAQRTANLHLQTKPQRADVVLDDTVIGQTPLVAAVQPGFKMMMVRKRGYSTVSEGVELRKGMTIKREYALEKSVLDEDAYQNGSQRTPVAQYGRGPARVGAPHFSAARGGSGVKAPVKKQRMEISQNTVRADDRPKAGQSETRPTGMNRAHPAKKLLITAQKASAARKYQAAVKAYRRLIRRYPLRPEARPARVSLGRLLLGPLGRPAAALRAFERYLSRTKHGTLAQEAAYGRIQALRALGRRKQEIVALRAFIKRFPGAVQKSNAVKRLRKLVSGAKARP